MNKHILVIDDDEAVRKSFMLALEETGHRVNTAESGEKGIKKVKATTYDLVFLDLKMPGLNGVETLRQLRQLDIAVPVYIVTAFHKEFLKDLKLLSDDGIDFELLKKPIGSDEIIELTESMLGY
ncbi:MAG: response regulator [Candidatus Aminicenantes bacterium]|nr:response regulator [Candidatus Aminicenantes bacterium]NIM78240.1 response regulator [Candidatus Aminicenantes bacterium]NIN23746.1 response regulator [Candidatus Aminicenantes bacterium]NIN47453.1 response regulator [Candidatus Aminicenantes bacterium]NIN90381.1 response regulator [Candidatus Aminicenantes bacterium]